MLHKTSILLSLFLSCLSFGAEGCIRDHTYKGVMYQVAKNHFFINGYKPDPTGSKKERHGFMLNEKSIEQLSLGNTEVIYCVQERCIFLLKKGNQKLYAVTNGIYSKIEYIEHCKGEQNEKHRHINTRDNTYRRR